MNFIRDIAERYSITEEGKTLGELLAINPGFRKTLEEVEKHWLDKANAVLTEILDEIQARVALPETTMGDLVRAIDVISDKYNLHLGKPTSLNASAQLNFIKNLSDGELDKRIKELEDQFLPTPPQAQLLHHQRTPLTAAHSEKNCDPSLEDGIPPLPSSITVSDNSSVEGGVLPSKKESGRRRITIMEKMDDDKLGPSDDSICMHV